MPDVIKKLDSPRNVDQGVRTIGLLGRVVWDKGPILQLRLPKFDVEGQRQRILELRIRKPWVSLGWYLNESRIRFKL